MHFLFPVLRFHHVFFAAFAVLFHGAAGEALAEESGGSMTAWQINNKDLRAQACYSPLALKSTVDLSVKAYIFKILLT